MSHSYFILLAFTATTLLFACVLSADDTTAGSTTPGSTTPAGNSTGTPGGSTTPGSTTPAGNSTGTPGGSTTPGSTTSAGNSTGTPGGSTTPGSSTTAGNSNGTSPHDDWSSRGVWEETNLTAQTLCSGDQKTIDNCKNIKVELLSKFHVERKMNITEDPACLYVVNGTQYNATVGTPNETKPVLRCRVQGTFVNNVTNATEPFVLSLYNFEHTGNEVIAIAYWGTANVAKDERQFNLTTTTASPNGK